MTKTKPAVKEDLVAENRQLRLAVRELRTAMKQVCARADRDLKKHFRDRTTECEQQYEMFIDLIAKHKWI